MSEQHPEPGDGAPDLEQLLGQIQGVDATAQEMIGTMTAVHATWFKAWLDAGPFTRDEAFELVRIMVAAASGGLRALSPLPAIR